jgi:hypothetical protein
MAETWSPRFTRALWGLVSRAVGEGMGIADVRERLREEGVAPDAATLSHLYSRAVASAAATRAEADYRSRVDPDVYLGRRPGGQHIADVPQGWTLSARWRQVIRVTGTDPLTGTTITRRVSVISDRLLTRGEAIDRARAAVGADPAAYGVEAPEFEYELTLRGW